jgi:hypothetical protein
MSILDPGLASDHAERLIEKINTTMGPGWSERLAHPDRAEIAFYRDTGAAVLYCPVDGVFHLRPSDGQLMFTMVRADTFTIFRVEDGGELEVDNIGPINDARLQ